MKAILSTILIIASIGIFFWYINPTYMTIQGLQEEEARFDEALNRSKELIAVRDALLSKYNTFESNDIERLEKVLPDTIDNVRLILEIDTIASRYGMSIQGIDIAQNEGNTGSADVFGTGQNDVGSIQLSFSVLSSYQDFIAFLKDIEDSLRIVDVVSISFSSDDAGLYKFGITLRMYWLKS